MAVSQHFIIPNILGARLYYLRHISHDWPQATLIQILIHVQKAMKPGYSRIIINDWILLMEGASKLMTAQDTDMMSIRGGMERTEDLHKEYSEEQESGKLMTRLRRV